MSIAYLNERSIENQYSNQKSVHDAIREWLHCLRKYLSGNNCELCFSHELWSRRIFDKTFDRELQKDERLQLKKLLTKNTTQWTNEPKQDYSAKYTSQENIDVSGSSMAEAYERPESLLLNMTGSWVSEPNADVCKNQNSTKLIPSFSDIDKLTDFLIKKGCLPHNYDFNSTIPPRDQETMLSDSTKFNLTNEPPQQGRHVYREKATGYLCYVDNENYGKNAHIEVFDGTTRRMVCTYDINSPKIHHEMKKNEKNRTI